MLLGVSVDLDELRHYQAIHGLSGSNDPGSFVLSSARGRRATRTSQHLVYDLGVPRLLAWARSLELPLTLFAVGADMAYPPAAAALRDAVAEGHEIGNHTLDHRYDLVRLPPAELHRQIATSAHVLTQATGQRPRGFRAPGYTLSSAVVEEIEASGAEYDASCFPCPSYWAAKAAVMGVRALRGGTSSAIVGDPRALVAPRRPYRRGARYFQRGAGLRMIPVQVTPNVRLPFIGTSLVLAPGPVRRALTEQLRGEPTINLEMHGIEALDERDGLEDLAPSQPDLRIPWEEKLDRLGEIVRSLSASGYERVTHIELARRALP